MQVSRWGNSLAVRLPKKLVEQMGLVEGDEIRVVDVVQNTLLIEKDNRREAALAALASFNLPLPADYKFDREEANER